MEQYIKKTAVVAEVKELYNDIDKCISDLILARGKGDERGISDAHWRMETLMVNTQQVIQNTLDILETKEVDLEEEIELIKGDYEQVEVAWNNDFDFIARHFYELGLKTKGE